MHILKICIKELNRNDTMRINLENAHKKHAQNWVEQTFYPIRKSECDLQWKHIYQINSSMSICYGAFTPEMSQVFA